MQSEQVRQDIPPLNQPAPSVPADQLDAAKIASIEAFRLAMLTSAGLLLIGALVNAAGISDRQAAERPVERRAEAAPPA